DQLQTRAIPEQVDEHRLAQLEAPPIEVELQGFERAIPLGYELEYEIGGTVRTGIDYPRPELIVEATLPHQEGQRRGRYSAGPEGCDLELVVLRAVQPDLVAIDQDHTAVRWIVVPADATRPLHQHGAARHGRLAQRCATARLDEARAQIAD